MYEIVKVPAPVLKVKSKPVETVDAAIQKQMRDMLETMYNSGSGIGLAANQVGIENRVFVMDLRDSTWSLQDEDGKTAKRVVVDRSERENDAEEPKKPIMLANPEIIWTSEEKSVYEEGCLSIPGYYADVERPAKVRLKYLDIDGKEQEMEADGLASHCIQHEIDHLDGVLFIDYLSKIKRDMIIRKMRKAYGT